MNSPLGPGGAEVPDWRSARPYRSEDPADCAILDAMDRKLAGLNYIDTPIWVFDAERCQCLWANVTGLRVWRADSVADLQRRDIASTQSEAVYTLLNDYLDRVDAGEAVATWVTLNPAGTTRRFLQSHHIFVLEDGRKVLLIEAQPEPPAEEMLAFASNYSLTIGLYEMNGQFVSGNPAFLKIAALHDVSNLNTLILDPLRDWPTLLQTQSVLVWETELSTERGRGYFRCELRRVMTHTHVPRAILSVFDLTEERLAAAERAHNQLVERSLAEKETLLKEIHHRVKNNLQIVSSLLTLQADQQSDPVARSVLLESAHRVISMALIHEQMYGVTSLDRIDLGAYASRLVDYLRAALAPSARVKVVAADVRVTLDLAVPLGLILNELVTNAFKYGTPKRSVDRANPPPSDDDWDVRVTVGGQEGSILIEVEDRGPGLPEGFNPRKSSSLGLQIIQSLARQLRGTLTATSPKGAVLRFTCSNATPPPNPP